MRVIGIDPGKSNGGIAIYDEKIKDWALSRQPDENEWKKIFDTWDRETTIIAIEKLNLREDDRTSPAFYAIANLVQQTERLIATLSTLGFDVVEIYPVSWQSIWRIQTKGKTADEKKYVYQKIAVNLTGRKVALWGSDAVLIAYYLQKKRYEDPKWIQDRVVGGIKNLHIFGQNKPVNP